MKYEIYFCCLNNNEPIKKRGKIYHSLLIKNLNETNGIVEVQEEIKIQIKYIKTA